MGLEKITTSDGVKIRDTRTKQLKGSIGDGKTQIPTATPQVDADLPAALSAGTLDDPATQDAAYAARLREQAEALRSRQQIKATFDAVAYDLNLTPEQVREAFEAYRTAGPRDYDDVDIPDPAFRYHEDPLLVADPDADPDRARAWRKLGYEHYLAQPHPVFVYGTLRVGQGNHHLMHGAVSDAQTATMAGIAVYGAHRGFPYAAEHDDPTAVTVGDIVWLHDTDHGRSARQSMDYLEGFSSDHPSASHYERVLRPVTVPDATSATGTRTVQAWTYLARGWSKDQLREDDRILDGDWVAAKTAYRAPRPRYDMNGSSNSSSNSSSRNFDDNPWVF